MLAGAGLEDDGGCGHRGGCGVGRGLCYDVAGFQGDRGRGRAVVGAEDANSHHEGGRGLIGLECVDGGERLAGEEGALVGADSVHFEEVHELVDEEGQH